MADVWVNSLWFFSLALSLTTALVAVLTKQWLHQYISVVSDISPLGRGRIRQYRYMGLEKWQVPMIIGLLPILLHVSLGLFFTGLCIYLFALHAVIAYTVASLSGIVYAAYLVFLFLPLFHYNCPYKTPLTDYLFGIYRTIYNTSRFICCRSALDPNAIPRTTRDAERRGVHLAEVRDAIDAEAISWLHSTSSNTPVQRIALEAALGIHLDGRRGNADNIIDEIFERHSGLELEMHPLPATSSKRPDQILETIPKDTTSSLLAILHSQGDNIVLPEGIWTCLLNYEEWRVPLPASESASSVIQLAAKLIEAWRKGLTPDPSQQLPIPSSKRHPLRDYLSSKDSEATLALVNGLSIMTRSFFNSSAAGDLVDVMRMFGYKLRDEKNSQNVKLLVHGISNTIRVIQRLPAQYLDQKSYAQNAFLISSSCIFPKLEESDSKTHLALLEILCCSDRYAFTLTDMHSQPEIFFTNAIRCFLSSYSYRSRPNHSTPRDKTVRPKGYEPSWPQHLELKVIERIVGPFFNQGYIADRGHTQVKFLRFFGPYFELKDRGILLKIFEEEGGLQALDRKFGAMIEQSATPKELAPTTGFAHLVANQMIETNTFDSLHLPDPAKKSPFTDNLSVLIRLLLYNSSGLLTIGRLLKTLYQSDMPQSTWKEFVEQLRQWMADKREELGRLHNIEDIRRVPDLLLEKADIPLELLADPRTTV